MLYISILISDRNLDPELWAVIWQAKAPSDLTLHGAYNLAGNKCLFIWETDSAAGLQFIDNFNQIGELDTYPAFDRTSGWQAAFIGDIEAWATANRDELRELGTSPDEIETRMNAAVELRQAALEAPTRHAARKIAREWMARQATAGDKR